MSREQRWAASGVVVLLGALWGGIALAGVWLVVGLVAVRRVASGAWRWWPPAALGAVVAAFSLVAAVSARPDGPDWWVLLLGFQGLALLAWAVLLWTPPPVTGTREDAA